MKDHIRLLTHSSIRIKGDSPDVVMYFDPFQIKDEPHDADMIFITHEHFDHFSPEDIEKVAKEDTILICPESMLEASENCCIPFTNVLTMKPNQVSYIAGVGVEAIPAYNVNAPFHTKDKNWVGYLISVDETDYYITGDTHKNEDNFDVPCDVIFVPIGGTYTFSPEEGAEFVNELKPKYAIPTHYGNVVGSETDADAFAELVNEDIEILVIKEY